MDDIQSLQTRDLAIPKSLDASLVQKAVNALLKHVENAKQKGKSQLFDEDDVILAIVTLKSVPDKNSAKPQRIAIPNSLHKETSEICIFVKDPQADVKKTFAEQNVKVSKVIGLSKLRTNYKEFEAKRQLCGSYDLFLADSRIIPFLPRLLGKQFFKKKRQPIPVDLKVKNISKEIEKARDSTFLYKSGGACSAVRIARTSFDSSEIVENIITGIENIISKVPKKWRNIQSIYIKTSDSVALPIFNSLPTKILRIQTEEEAKEVAKKTTATANTSEKESSKRKEKDNRGRRSSCGENNEKGERTNWQTKENQQKRKGSKE